MKFLCICQYGHSRSVALSRVLHGLNQSAVAIGWSTSGDAIQGLSAWADKILVVCGHAHAYVPSDQRHKVIDFQVGPDRWSNPYNQELLAIFKRMVSEKLPDFKR